MSASSPDHRDHDPSRRRALGWCAAGVIGLRAGPARALDTPTGAVVLTLTGKVHATNGPRGAEFDMAMLEALPQASFMTKTPWYASPRRFTGPLLRDVLQAAGARGTLLRVSALNDYRVDVPVDDAMRHDLLVARLLDDRPMAVRERGPLFLVYPFDSRPELRTAVYYSRSAWQLRAIDVQ